MHLDRLIAALGPIEVANAAPLEITELAYDTRAVPQGSLFFDGSKFYGMTEYGGTSGTGMIFSLDLPEPSAGILVIAGGLVRLIPHDAQHRIDRQHPAHEEGQREQAQQRRRHRTGLPRYRLQYRQMHRIYFEALG